MKNSILLIIFLLNLSNLWGQTREVDPAFPLADEELTLTVDVTGTSLEGYDGDVWIWAWLPDLDPVFDAPTNVNPATTAQDDAKVTRSGSNPNIYTFTFTPTVFFGKEAAEITRIGFKLKSVDWNDGIQSDNDLFIDISEGELEVVFTSPSTNFIFVNESEVVTLEGSSSQQADLSLFINDALVTSINGTSLSFEYTVATTGTISARLEGSSGGTVVMDEIQLIVRQSKLDLRPSGIIQGINYSDLDNTQATFCLYAPLKTSVYLVGDFNQWQVSNEYQLAEDEDFFWITVDNLTAGQEYAFQYLIDEEILVGDPYADKILDPNNDSFIPDTTYPNLLSYPQNEVSDGWVSVMQTNQIPYNWQSNNFSAPAKEDLVIYELLVRDFDDEQNYQAVVDRLDYLKELGINAIHLMPIMEFDGNNSWGYNPAYFFAVDKYYGTKNDLKNFIDICHENGIAVILDMVLNHTHERNPLAWMYWDHTNFRPSADNPWLNQEATHPFNVFFDFNHESTDTKNFVDTVNYYWLNEFRFDGFRFDLSKGFTQTFSGNNVGLWGQYDQSRVDLLTRMADNIWSHHPDAYVILEHLSDNSEEKVLADYGMMLWGNMNHNYNQNTMGYSSDSNLDWSYHGIRGWNEPNLISYMESHDEERLIYRNLEFGNSLGAYNTTNIDIALERVKAASAIYYSIPGPKMLWQFGELGYDKPINLCPDGSIQEGCRVDEKPIPWQDASNGLGYDQELNRKRLYDVTSELIQLKTSSSTFSSSEFRLDESSSLVKKIVLDANTSSPTNVDESSFVVVANFNLQNVNESVEFPYSGTWFRYFAAADPLEVSGTSIDLHLQAGEFRIYSNIALDVTAPELTNFVQPIAPTTLEVTEIDGEGLRISWIDNSAIEKNYKVLRDGEILDTLGQNSQTFLDTDVESFTSYTYQIEVSNENYSVRSEALEFTTSGIITGVQSTRNEIYVVPNPAKESLLLISNLQLINVEVIDLNGKVQVYQKEWGENREMNISALKPGLYIIKAISKNGDFISQRFIKE